MCGSYSSRSSIVHSWRSRSSNVAKRWQICFVRSPYGIGCRTAATLLPAALRILTTAREVWLLPAPVRTAQTAMTGLVLCSIVCRCPNMQKSAPQAFTSAALCMTTSCG